MSAPDLPREKPARSSYDVVIVGGAMIGSSIAWQLVSGPAFTGSVLVVERDPAYRFASTSHTNSCIRQQFSTAINVRISQFGAHYIRNFRRYLEDDPRVPEIVLQSFGYLYLAGSVQAAANLKAAWQIQHDNGAATRHMTPDEIAQAYPFYHLDDIAAGNHNTTDEGYFDGATMFDWWKRKAREKGVEYCANEVTGLDPDSAGTLITGVRLAGGETVRCGTLVNCGGPRAAQIAAMAGIRLPVEPRKRFTFVFDAARPLECDLPLTIDPSGVHVRSDGRYYMAGCAPDDDRTVAIDDFEMDHAIWEEKVWPAIAHRIPQFDALRVIQSWAGHYAYNTLDQNAIAGPHPVIANLLFANGFSGHGFQQAPAIGRGIAEWIVHGEYRTLDLSPLSFERIARSEPLLELAVI